MRLTRAAQRAQQPVEEPTPDATDASEERSPLNEITPNASPEHVNLAEDEPKKTLTRTKSKRGGKKGAKAKKGKTVEDDQVPVADEPQAADDAIEAAVEEPIAEPSQGGRFMTRVPPTTTNCAQMQRRLPLSMSAPQVQRRKLSALLGVS